MLLALDDRHELMSLDFVEILVRVIEIKHLSVISDHIVWPHSIFQEKVVVRDLDICNELSLDGPCVVEGLLPALLPFDFPFSELGWSENSAA